MIDRIRDGAGNHQGEEWLAKEDLKCRAMKPSVIARLRRMRSAIEAAEDALEQLDWCIGYLHGIRKTKISSQLARNRAHIKRHLMRDAASPIPSEVTAET